jgi:hypothetical protein
MRVSDMTDLPDPDSPTTANISPLFNSKENSCKAGSGDADSGNSTVIFFILSIGSKRIIKSEGA